VLGPIVAIINPNLKSLLDLKVRMATHVDELLRNPELLDGADHEVVYHHLMAPQTDKGKHQILSRTALWHEVNP
jgi:hypothetical protein